MFTYLTSYDCFFSKLNFLSYFQQLAAATATISGDSAAQKAVLAQRRSIILVIIGSTTSSNDSLTQVLENGFLKTVKSWLDEILNGSVGGVDLLLVLVENTTNLPVTKAIVKDSGLGIMIGKIGKHSICAGTPNEGPIKERVKQLKEAWNKSVKAMKEKAAAAVSTDKKEGKKRDIDAPAAAPAAKKARVEDTKKKSSLSNLLKSVNPNGSTASSESAKPAPKKCKWSSHIVTNLSTIGKY